MKYAWYAPFLVVFAFAELGCQLAAGGTDVQDLGSGTPPDSPAPVKSMKLYDGNAVPVGWVTSCDANNISLFTANGYFAHLAWDGTAVDTYAYFTGADGSGTMFIYMSASTYGKFVVSANGVLYAPTNLDEFGNAVGDSKITEYQSFYTPASGLSNTQGVVAPGSLPVPMGIVTEMQIGLPASLPLSLPLELRFE